VLHAGPDALVGGLSAAEVLGMRNWHRDVITVLVTNPLSFEPLPGVTFFRTRRPMAELVAPRIELPVCRIEPAVLMFAGYERSRRTAHGAIAATVQQRLTTALADWVERLRPLRRAAEFRGLVSDVAGGAQSLAESATPTRSGGSPTGARWSSRSTAASTPWGCSSGTTVR